MLWLIGNKGMLGTEIARQLKENNIAFLGTDIEVDITNPEALEKFASGKNISYIINCSAYTAVDRAESDADFAAKLNVEGPENIARLASKIRAKMIHISTDYVFDGRASFPYTEDMPVNPCTVYGKTKAEGEKKVRNNLSEHYIIRTAWLYGWAGKNFVYTMIKAMNSNPAVKVVNDQLGTPTFAGDLASVIIKIIQKDNISFGTYNCTDLGQISWWDFTNEIKAKAIECGFITNKDCQVLPCSTEEYPTPAKRPAYSVLSKEKIQKALGLTLPDWKESLEVFLKSPFFDKSRIE